MLRHRAPLFAGLCLFLFAATARAEGSVQVAAGPTIGGSGGNGWHGDGVVPGVTLRGAYRFGDWIGPVFVGREAYGKVDERLLTLISLGVQAWWPHINPRPFARLSWVHQHEEYVRYAEQKPFGVLFGVGNGIRHRGGAEAAIGADYAFAHTGKFEWFASGELYADWLFASEAPGPAYYPGGGLLIGFNLEP